MQQLCQQRPSTQTKPIENKTRSNVTIISYSKSNLFGLNASKLENVTASVKSMYLYVLFTTLIHSKKSDGVRCLCAEMHTCVSTVTATSVSNYCFYDDPYWKKRAKLILPSAYVTDRF